MDKSSEKRLFQVSYKSAYLNSIAELLQRYKEYSGGAINPYYIPLTITSAAALETILNEAIITECRHRFPQKHIKRLSNSHLGMSLGGKLDDLGWLLTDNIFITNNESEIYQCLRNIIKFRNEIMHRKPYYKEIEFEVSYEETEEGMKQWSTLDDNFFKTVNSTTDSLKYEDFDRFYRAVSELEISIVNITTSPPVIENDLFIKNV